MSNKVAIVTGSNSGLGYAIVKSLCKRFKGVVYLTSLYVKPGKKAVNKLSKLGLHPKYYQLDITDRQSIVNFRDHILENYGGIDIIVNNAGVASNAIQKTTYEEDKHIIETNFKSMLLIHDIIIPLVRANGRVLNISSSAGHLSNVTNKYWIERLSKEDLKVEDINEFVDWYLESSETGTFNKEDIADNGRLAAYKVSKVALSAFTRIQQKELILKGISVNSMHPGIMRTDMTWRIGFLSADQAAKTPIYLVLDAPQSLKGEYVWYDRRIINWYDYNPNVVYYDSVLSKDIIFFSLFTTAEHYITRILN